MRLFIALDINQEIRSRASVIINELKQTGADVKFTKPENLHFTVKFLGEVNEQRVKEIRESVTGALDGIEPFSIALHGIGFFGNPNYMKTVWIGVNEGREELVKLCKAVNSSLEHIRKENRKPSPHLTLGRVRSARNREPLLNKINDLKDVKMGSMAVNEIVLKNSILSREGPQYSDLKVFRLS